MTLEIKHAFQSPKADDPTAFADDQVTPSRWNEKLDAKMATGFILGRTSASAGDVEEVPPSAARTLLELVKGTSAGNIPVLDGSGKLDTAILPSLAITETFVVNSQAAMLALTAQMGDVAIRTDLNKSFILSTNSPGTLADWKELLTPTDAVLSVAGLTGAISASALKTALAIAVADITDASANGRSLISAADYAAMRTLLSLVPGTNVQAYSALLAAIAGLTPTNGNVITGNGTTFVSAAPAGGAGLTKVGSVVSISSGTSAIDITTASLFDGTYEELVIKYWGITGSGGDPLNLGYRVGSSWSTISGGHSIRISDSGTSGASFPEFGRMSASVQASGEIRISRLGTAELKTVQTIHDGADYSSSRMVCRGSIDLLGASNVNGIRIATQSYTISSGKYQVFGVKAA